MIPAPPALARGKSILIQVCTSADPSDEEICKKMETSFREHKPALEPSNDKSYRTEKPGPPLTNSWFIIRETSTGPKISNIFRGRTEEKRIHARLGTNCVLVGSDLYDIGGRGSTCATRYHLSNYMRCLDTQKLDDSWKTEVLPFYCANAITAVSGNFIYLFPSVHYFRWTPEYLLASPKSSPPWAFFYDTIAHRAYELELPDGCCFTDPPFCVPLEGGILVPVTELKSQEMKLYVHEIDQNKWERIGQVEDPFPTSYSYQYFTSNGIFYVYKTVSDTAAVLSAYNISTFKYLGSTRLPEFDNMDLEFDPDDVFIVPVADSEFCFLWHRGSSDGKEESPLYYAKISVSFSPSLKATLLKQAVLDINGIRVVNCLPYGSFSNDQEEDAYLNDISDTTRKMEWSMRCSSEKHELKEVDWKARCMYLGEELQRKEEELRRKEEVLQSMKEEPQRVQKKLKRSCGEQTPPTDF